MKSLRSTARVALAAAAVLAGAPAMASVTFYPHEGFQGRAYTTQRGIGNLAVYGLQDRASSAVVSGDRWEVCEDPGYRGHCVILRPGNYPSLSAMGLNNQISAVRPVPHAMVYEPQRYAPPPVVVQDFRHRQGERLYEAPVVAVRAVMGAPEQRCWIEREKVVREDRGGNVPGAIAGAVIGGILGHQVGSGGHKDATAVGGAVVGAVIGAQVPGERVVGTQNVQHCGTVPGSAQPAYWDVIYRFRGLEHHVQLTQPPGPSVTVNRHGEPRAN